MADFSKEISELEAMLNAAVRSVSVDGTSTQFDLETAQARLNYLKSLDDATVAAKRVRPRVSQIKLGGAF